MPRPRLMVGSGSTTLIVVTKGSVMLFRGNDSVSLAKTTSPNPLTTQTSPRGPQQRARSTRAARLASPLSFTRSACGWLARPSTCPSTTDWCRSIIEVCLSPFTPNGTAQSKNPRRWLEERNGSAAYGPASPQWVKPSPARSTRQATSASRPPTTGSATNTAAAVSRSRSWVTPSRSQPVARSSAPMKSNTTAPANTVPSPTPAAHPHDPTPPKPPPRLEHTYRSQTGTRVPELDTNSSTTVVSKFINGACAWAMTTESNDGRWRSATPLRIPIQMRRFRRIPRCDWSGKVRSTDLLVLSACSTPSVVSGDPESLSRRHSLLAFLKSECLRD